MPIDILGDQLKERIVVPIQKEKTQLMSERLMQLNIDETALEFNRNELARLLEVEQKITTLSYTYDFDREPSIEEISKYVSEHLKDKADFSIEVYDDYRE